MRKMTATLSLALISSTVFTGELYQGIKEDSNWGDKQDITIAAKDDASKENIKSS